MADICMDTNVLAEFLVQYFTSDKRTEFKIREGPHIDRTLCYHINSLLSSHYRYEFAGIPPCGVLLASAVAFVELGRKFDSIFEGRVTISQFAAFVDSPPPFFTIEPLGFDVARDLVNLPSMCWIRGEAKGLEAIDNVHVATTRVREDCRLAATDGRIVEGYTGAGILV